jgi:hypothetical protein
MFSSSTGDLDFVYFLALAFFFDLAFALLG